MTDDSWLMLVRIARDAGDVSSLLPPGVHSLYDAPYLFVDAVRMALYYLSFDELPEEERPPQRIWSNQEKMEAWWREVKDNRKAKSRGQGNLAGMVQNEALAEAFKGVNFRRA